MNKKAFYEDLNRDARALLAGETSFLAALANCSALLFERLEGVNWAGFYLLTEKGVSSAWMMCTRSLAISPVMPPATQKS